MANHFSILSLRTPWTVWKGKKRTLKDELPRSVGAQYATGDQWRNNSRKNEGMESKQKQHLVVEVTGDGSKVWCCKEWYCIGTWNVRSMNQGKLKVVKQRMARVNVDILGISELKCTEMGEFNSDDHCIYHCGQESLRRNGVAIIVNKRVWNAVLGCNLKNDRMISVRFQGKPFNIMVIQGYALTSNAEEAEGEWFYEDIQGLLNTQKRYPSHYRVLECKSRKSGNTWSNRQIWPWSKKWTGQKLIEFCQENALVITNTLFQQHKRRLQHVGITRRSIPKSDWLYSLQPKMEKLYTVSKNKTGSWLWLRSWMLYYQIQI